MCHNPFSKAIFFLGGAPNHASATDSDLAAGQCRHASGIQRVLRGVNALVQRFGGIVIQHEHRLLADDRTGVHPHIDEVHRAARHSYAVRQRLFPRGQPGK